jgi:protein regulator of cytokinesis 1
VYPVRHEQLSAQEEKLKQLYNSKLEQLNALTNRLSTLSYTLGSSFFSDDILNPTPAPGELDASPIKADDEDYDHHVDSLLRDVTPERFNRLEKELVRGKAEINRRLVSLSEIFEQIALLYTDLGILLPQVTDPIPSMSEFPYPRPFHSTVATRTDPFSVSPAPDPDRQRREYFPLFASFVSKLQEAVDEGRDAGGVEGIDPSLILIEWFEHLQIDVCLIPQPSLPVGR